MRPFTVIADDRTGAMETAGACADLGCSTAVVPFGLAWSRDAQCTVIDLASRHLAPSEARVRAASAPSHALHKIDSTLRGSWAHEVVARRQAHSLSVLVVPAFPAAGRTCEGGVVRVDGVPVAEGAAATDARGPVGSSRPADHLCDAGAASIDSLTPADLVEWLASPEVRIGVCDARSDGDLREIAQAWSAHLDVVLAGTSAVVAVAAEAMVDPALSPTQRPSCDAPVLVVCGSLHPMALAQSAAAEASGLTVLRPSAALDDPVAVASALGEIARDAIGSRRFGTVVVVGGDTTAAVLGDRAVVVGGTLGPGIAWSRAWGDTGPLLVTKPGGFGTPSSIVDLFRGAHP